MPAFALVLTVAFGADPAGVPSLLPPLAPGREWRLVWHDEFDGPAIDETQWERIGDSRRRDGFWIKDDAYLDGKGCLVLRTRKDGQRYTCGAVRTLGKFEHRYGFWEARCRFPKQQGHWPAFWLMPAKGLKDAEVGGTVGAEIDIMEKAWLTEKINHAIHWNGYGSHHKSEGREAERPGLNEGFHTFAVLWTPQEYIFYIDGRETWRTKAGGASHALSYAKLTEEIGPWAGKITEAALPDYFVVDYVRVYDPFHSDGTPCDLKEGDVIQRSASEENSTPHDYGAISREIASVRKLLDTPLRDTSVCLGPDKTYYLTGTCEPFYGDNRGIRVWRSKDLEKWESLGMVWQYGSSPWHKKFLEKKKPLWAPEIHYVKGTFWLTYSMPGWDDTPKTSGSGLLRSTTGKPEGPYVDVQPESRMGDEIDASLFEDSDGAVYFVWHSGKIARMKPDMSGLAEPYHWLKVGGIDPAPNHHSSLCTKIFGAGSFDHVGYEGATLFRAKGRYYLAAAEMIDGHYHGMVAESDNVYGPYGRRYVAVPDGGHVTFFQDVQGMWWSTFFGNDASAPQMERPGIVPVVFAADGHIRAKTSSRR